MLRHDVIKRRSFHGLVSFSSNANFIIIVRCYRFSSAISLNVQQSTTNPATLRILSACTLTTLSIIPSSSLTLFSPPQSPPLNNHNINKDTDVLQDNPVDSDTFPPDQPKAVFALSHRLLAYASPPPRPDSPTATPLSTRPRTREPSRDDIKSLSQADISTFALRVGGNVLSGLRTLGEVAYSAARTRMSGDQAQVSMHRASPASNTFFSRSAPASSVSHEQRHSQNETGDAGAVRAVVDLGEDSEPLTGRCKAYAAPLLTPTDDTKSFYVTILDLRSLLSTPSTSMPQPAVVAEFMVSNSTEYLSRTSIL